MDTTSIENIEKLYKNSWQDIYSLKLTEPKTTSKLITKTKTQYTNSRLLYK